MKPKKKKSSPVPVLTPVDEVQVFLIDPERRVVQLQRVEPQAAAIQLSLRYESVNSIPYSDDEIIVVGDNALNEEPNCFFLLQGMPFPLCGRAFVIGVNDDGDLSHCKIELQELTSLIQWLSADEAQAVFKSLARRL